MGEPQFNPLSVIFINILILYNVKGILLYNIEVWK